jgi:hypothetical protein
MNLFTNRTYRWGFLSGQAVAWAIVVTFERPTEYLIITACWMAVIVTLLMDKLLPRVEGR